MKFENYNVVLPKHDADVTIIFPGGKRLIVQARPGNADTKEDGSLYNGSLDLILPDDACVTCWTGDDMQAAPEAFPGNGTPEQRTAKQLVTELPGSYE